MKTVGSAKTDEDDPYALIGGSMLDHRREPPMDFDDDIPF